MAKEIKMPLPSAADLFSTQEERDNESRESVREIPLGEISDFPNHPFKVKMDESIRGSSGIIQIHNLLFKFRSVRFLVFRHVERLLCSFT